MRQDNYFNKRNPKFWFTLLAGVVIGPMAVGCGGPDTITVHDTKTVTVNVPGPTVTHTVKTVPQSCLDMVRVGLQVQTDIDTITNSAQHMHDLASQMYVAMNTKNLAAINAADQAQHELTNALAQARTDLYNARPSLAKSQSDCQAETK